MGNLQEDHCPEWEKFHTKVAQKIKTQFMFNNIFFPQNRTIYEIMWKNMVEPDSSRDNIIRRRTDALCMPGN